MEVLRTQFRWPALVLLALAAGGGLQMTAQTRPDAPPPAPTTPVPPPPPVREDDFLSLCRDQLALLTADGHTPETLVVTLPDPLESHFARELDVFLASLRRGLEHQGYVQDRHCLAWTAAPPRHLERAGMVLFRGKAADRKRVLAVLVVGETPTWGVHPKALADALDLLWSIERGEVAGSLRIRVLGPTFSGSAASLGGGLGEWIRKLGEGSPAIDLNILSGTASSPDNREVILRALGCSAATEPVCTKPPMRAKYASAVTDNDTLQRVLLGEFVPHMLGNIPEEAVALLQESSVANAPFPSNWAPRSGPATPCRYSTPRAPRGPRTWCSTTS